MPVVPETINHIIAARGVSIDDAAACSAMSVSRFRAMLDGEHTPTKRQVVNFATKLAIPYYAIFSKTFRIKPSEILDFRTAEIEPMKLGLNAKNIAKTIKRRDFFAALYSRLDLSPPEILASVEEDENPEQTARAVRFELKLDDFQYGDSNKEEFYKKLRDKIEQLGIFTIQDHNIDGAIDGYALFDRNFSSHMIFVSSSIRNSGRRSFTLAHELAHIIGKRSATSNDYETDNEVEKFCNDFAASLLMPRERFIQFVEDNKLDFDPFDLARNSAIRVADFFKVSVSAVLVRAFYLGYSKKNHFFEFNKNLGSPDHPDTIKPKNPRNNTGRTPDQGPIIAAEIGKRGVALIAKALKEGVTTPWEVFENTGLSKSRIERLPAYAAEVGLEI